uniref:Thrombopoietin n=1 Tax=Seriola lalandi dorsalis TaxID=1841481 RepID=A0A3B4YRH3_SERLL
MALSRLLLLCMVASEVWDAETKPIDFVCNRATRRAMNIVAEMESALSDCNGVMTLSTPVQLPCTELHVASWENKSVCWHMYESKILYYSHSGFITSSLPCFFYRFFCLSFSVCVLLQNQEKRGDIAASFRLLIEGVKAVRALNHPGCVASLLQKLENNINNYLLILTHLQLSVRSCHGYKLHLVVMGQKSIHVKVAVNLVAKFLDVLKTCLFK